MGVSSLVGKISFCKSAIRQFKEAEMLWSRIIGKQPEDLLVLSQRAQSHIKGLKVSSVVEKFDVIGTQNDAAYNYVTKTLRYDSQDKAGFAHELVHACQQFTASRFQKLRNWLQKVLPEKAQLFLFPSFIKARNAYLDIYNAYSQSRKEPLKYLSEIEGILRPLPRKVLRLLKKDFLYEIQAYRQTAQKITLFPNGDKAFDREMLTLHREFNKLIRKVMRQAS